VDTGGRLSCTTCPDLLHHLKKKTEYTITVTNNGGCVNIDKITVFVTCDNNNIFVPNTFSPDGDGNNEIFYPRGRGVATVKSFRVFSRWGQQVFQKQNFMINDISSGWDGTFKGQKLPPDVYVYIIELYCDNGNVINLKGDVMLVR
jgi:gliding motility-associated-like protein